MKTKKGQTGMWVVVIIVVVLLVGLGVYLLETTNSTSTPVQAATTSTPTTTTTTPTITPTVTILSAPTTATTNQDIFIDWMINSDPGTTSHTAVHYGLYSIPNPTGPNDYPYASVYIGTNAPVKIPGEFSTTINIQDPGTYHYRAHTVINGQDYWSAERTITVTQSMASTPTTSTTSSTSSSGSSSGYSYGGY